MSLKQRIDADLKAALLGGEKDKATTLRGLKSVILNEEVAKGIRDTGLADADIENLLAREAKKRQESADLFKQGGNDAKAADELVEKEIIKQYLPQQLDEAAIKDIIDAQVTALGATSPAQMGQVIGAVKAQAGNAADGALVARLVKERLAQ